MPGGALRAVPHSASSTADRLAAHLSEFAEPRPANRPDTFVRLWRPTNRNVHVLDFHRPPTCLARSRSPPAWPAGMGATAATVGRVHHHHHHRRCAGLLLWALAGWTWTVLAVALGVTVNRPFKILKLIS